MPTSPRHHVAVLAACALLVLAGCAATGPATGDQPAADDPSATDKPTHGTTDGPGLTEPQTTTSPPRPDLETADCSGLPSLGLYGPSGDPSVSPWSKTEVAVGYTLKPNASLFLVAYVDGEAAGATSLENTYGSTLYADGATVSLDEPLTGTHTVRVVAHADTNGDGDFDAGTDRACTADDGGLLDTRREVVDFSRYADDGDEDDGSETPTPPDEETTA
jgi:hypothetical protein